MNVKILFKLLAIAIAAEIFYVCTKYNLWELYIEYPNFCTTFLNDPKNCTLDYGELSTSFLERYEQFCEKHFVSENRILSLPPCPCVPDSIRHDNAIESASYRVTSNGTHRPDTCTARQTVAIIIPYRDRDSHLHSLLQTLHPMLEKQHLAYQIFVVEQKKPDIFNKAVLMNAGFLEVSRNFKEFDCFIFHDVDMIPLDKRNFYVCLDIPRHLGGFVQIYDFKLLYEGIFGGVTAFKKTDFELVNGYSNQYYGWGGEDDDLLQRVKASKMMVNRFPPSVSRYAMIIHRADSGNPGNSDRTLGFHHNPERYRVDGLNSVNYTLEGFEKGISYTKIYISLPEPPSTLKTYNRSDWMSSDLSTIYHWFILFTLVVILALIVIFYSSSK